MPGGGPSAASSLYSGIFNAEAEDEASSSKTAVQEKKDTPFQETKSQIEEEKNKSTLMETAASTKPQGSAFYGIDSSCHTILYSVYTNAWSAALRFAPRKNINPQANKVRKQPASVLISSSFSSVPASVESEETIEAATTKVVETSQNAEPSTSGANISSSSRGWNKVGTESAPRGKVQVDALRTNTSNKEARFSLPRILAPPELSISAEELEKDKALFTALAEKRGEKKSNTQQWNSERQDDDEDEDVNGFANTSEGRKARKKKNKRKRNISPGHHGGLTASLRMDADYDVRVPNDYNEMKELMRSRREAIKQMVKAQEAEEALRKGGGYLQDDDEYESESEDDSYRRNKMGRFAPPAMYNQANSSGIAVAATQSTSPPASSKWYDDDDEKPYLSPPPRPPLDAPLPISSVPKLAMTGEEAYQRRLAMSQCLAPPPAANIAELSIKTEVAALPTLPDLASRAAAAAAIAARLAKAAPTPGPGPGPAPKPPPPSFVTSTAQSTNSASFAEELMKKQGWKKGEALGVEGNKGILDPILAERVEAEQRKKARPVEKPQHSNRGTLVNAREDERRNEERERYGTPSEVILLENMVDLIDIDDDLTGEIGEECAKHGYVQRVFIWPNGPNGVRIFVKFSGMAGAWRCVKELEGRFFGGKTVRARYYPLDEFERGNYMKVYNKTMAR